jgi:transposase
LVRRQRRKFSDEFKAETVQLVRSTGKSIAEAARDLDLSENSVRSWVREAEIEAGRGPEGALTKAERDELRELRKENRQLRMEREILKKATAFFAKESR